MKITKIILKNFSAIETAMNANEIEIDFSNSLNKVCLLIGPNGSGKTTLLSLLNPFADLGNLDVRNGNRLILENKDGYKEIHIEDGDDNYIVKHFYTPHKDKSHSVKSYIEKNGNELNVNGNVTSFKEYIKEELQLEPSYLKLIRLGSNVTSLIDLTATERKNFMTKIMDDIGVYLDYFKAVNTKLRQLGEMISHSVDKLDRLGILDKKEWKSEIRKIEKEIDRYQTEWVDVSNNIAVLQNEIDKIEDSHSLKITLDDITKKYKKMSKILENKDKIESTDVDFYVEKISELEKKILVGETEKENNTTLINHSLTYLNTLQEQLHSCEIQARKEKESDKELSRMEEGLKSIRIRLREYENIIGDYQPNYSKDEIETFIIFLKNTQNIISSTYDFGKKPVEKVVDLMMNKKNVQNYINSHLIDLDESSGDETTLFINKIAAIIDGADESPILSCTEDCSAKKVYSQIKNVIENSDVSDKNEDAQFYHDMDMVHQNFILVLPRFAEYKSIIDRLPDDVKSDFEIKAIYSKMKKLDFIYDIKKMNELLSLATEYDAYQKLLETYKTEEANIMRFSALANSNHIEEQIKSLNDRIEDEKDKILSLKERNSDITEEIKESQRSYELYSEIKETLERYDEVKQLYEKYTKEYQVYTDSSKKIADMKISETRLKLTIDDLREKLQQKVSSLHQYEDLTKELEKMNKIFDEMTLVKESLETKKGIPIYLVDNYLENTAELTNELLDIAYDGSIYIDKFDITPTEFSIPYYNKEKKIPDVRYASQGELSFLSIALSFALSSQSLSKYNIMLLDEIDGPLDKKNREKFIIILENQIDRIHSEQNFLITHNNMFSSYPVDIIDLSFNDNHDDYPMANYIEVKRIA